MFLMLLIGIAIMGLGFFVIFRNRRLEKNGLLKGVVQSCVPSSMEILGVSLPCSELTLEVLSPVGPVYKVVKDAESYAEGTEIDVYYNEETDTFDLAKNVAVGDIKGPLILVGFGSIFVILAILLMMRAAGGAVGDIADGIMLYGFIAMMILIGAFVGIVQPALRKKHMETCYKLPGKQVDYKTKRSRDKGTMYTPIYEFYYNGEAHTLEATVTGNGGKYKQIGRQVTIIMDPKKRKAYCLEDSIAGKNMGLLFLVIGILMLVFVQIGG